MLPVHELDVPSDELRFLRLSGRLSLELVATIGERWRRRFERLRTPEDLERWLAGAGLRPAGGCDQRDLDRVRELRGSIELLAVAAMADESYPRDAIARVNDAAGRPAPVPVLGQRRTQLRVATTAASAAAVARDAVELFGGPRADRIRECGADDCALVFVDTSPAGNRKWCSMRACGNRMKVARHRHRRQPSD